MVAYRQGDFGRALTEFRTVRRLSGSSHLLPLMVDCERGLGRHDRALELAASPEARQLGEEERLELAIVVSGVRRDLGQLDAALIALQLPALRRGRKAGVHRLQYAYADVLLALGRTEEAREWFQRGRRGGRRARDRRRRAARGARRPAPRGPRCPTRPTTPTAPSPAGRRGGR